MACRAGSTQGSGEDPLRLGLFSRRLYASHMDRGGAQARLNKCDTVALGFDSPSLVIVLGAARGALELGAENTY